MVGSVGQRIFFHSSTLLSDKRPFVKSFVLQKSP